jgi:hypothetical protein
MNSQSVAQELQENSETPTVFVANICEEFCIVIRDRDNFNESFLVTDTEGQEKKTATHIAFQKVLYTSIFDDWILGCNHTVLYQLLYYALHAYTITV